MDRRNALKLLTGAATAALAPALPAQQHEPVDVHHLPQVPPGATSIDTTHERLIAAEPELTLNPEGELTIAWKTVVPTQGATVYIGVPNDEVRLEFPIYSGSTAFPEDAPRTDHKAVVDLRAYAPRAGARYLIHGGVFAYRIEMTDPRRAVSRFIDRQLRYAVIDDRFQRAPWFTEGPNLALVGETTATLWWVTDLPIESFAEVAGTRLPATLQGNRYVATFDRLTPGTAYDYRVTLGSGEGSGDAAWPSRQYSLRTSPSTPDFSFVFTCDGRTGGLGGGETALEGINGESARALSIQMDRHRPHFLIFTGDLISGYTSSVDDYKAQLRSWKRIYGPLWRWMPIYTGMGNHESLVTALDQRIEFDKSGGDSAESLFAGEFLHPQNGPEPEQPGLPPYRGAVYSFEFGGCHFVQLNSDYWYSSSPSEIGGNYFGRLLPGQLAWLEQDLAQAKGNRPKHIFVFVHEPAFPNGGHVPDALWGGGSPEGVAARDRFWKAVCDADAVAVFSGHEHNYSRIRIEPTTPVHRDGSANSDFRVPVWQVTQGAAGAPFYPRDYSTPWSEHVAKFVTHTWSYCHITVAGEAVKLATYSFTGELLDEAQLAPR
jgi:hypothetical protein